MGKRLANINVENTDDHRRLYRQLLFTAPKEVASYISGVILFDETFWQKADNGSRFVDLLTAHGIIPGIKVCGDGDDDDDDGGGDGDDDNDYGDDDEDYGGIVMMMIMHTCSNDSGGGDDNDDDDDGDDGDREDGGGGGGSDDDDDDNDDGSN